MDESTFQELLTDLKLVVVHFSAPMDETIAFPDDMQHAVRGYATARQSCCALWPGQPMRLPSSVGVILQPTFDQLETISPKDSGSFSYGDIQGSGGDKPSEAAIRKSLATPLGRYNEWLVHGARPAGFFVVNPRQIVAKQVGDMSMLDSAVSGEFVGELPLYPAQIMHAFPDQTIYSLGPDGLYPLWGTENKQR